MRSSTGVTPVIGVVGFVTLVASLSVGVHLLLLGAEPAAYPPHLSGIVSLPFSAAMFLGTWGVLRYEGGSLAAIGLGKSALVPAILMFGLFWGIVPAGGVVYLLAAGASGELGAAVGMPWYWVPVWLALMLTLSNGLTEEFVFRGYIQNKCTAVVESHSRLPAAVGGILGAAVLFGVPHVPRAVILADASPVAVPWVLLSNAIPGIAYGLVYYLTRNVWYTGFVHGFGNATVVPFDPSAIPMFTPVASLVGVLIGVGYSYWASGTGHVTPVQNGRPAE